MPSLEELADQIRVCTNCSLCEGRTQAVPGDGPATARVFFIGEGPGYYEDKSGLPFVGAAGKFLDELLGLAGLRRSDVFITNVVKCRPPNNRDPQDDEIRACGRWLDGQLDAVSPPVVVTLGRHSMNRYLPGESISRVHGQPRAVGGMVVVPMFHPAAALHQQRYRALIEEDFRRLPALIAEAKPVTPEPQTPSPSPPALSEAEASQQMRLF
jgi:uracil-DNA glycosylase family 4